MSNLFPIYTILYTIWRAIANAEEFGAWFGVKLEGAFVEGAIILGRITYPGY
jgi:hypothetical protein